MSGLLRGGRVSAPPASPRRRRWTPPYVGTYFVRTEDLTVWQVRNVYRRDQQVQLVPATGGPHIYVKARDLEAGYQQVVR